jgi:uncharacterized protein (DUF1684 family)
VLAATAALAVLAFACATDPEPTAEPVAESESDPEAWRDELDAWIAERDAGLRKPDGWLSLAGLYWLEEGESSFGSDPSNAVVFPAGKSPARIGVFVVEDGAVRVRVEPGVAVTSDGEPVSELALATDAAEEPTLLEHGSLLWHAIDRGGRIGIRLKDRESPLLGAFAGMERYPADPAWRIEARFERYDPPKEILVPNIVGPALPEPCPGRVVFEHAGASHALEPTGEAGEELFVVFGDETNGSETYGGGRFLYADWPGEDGVVVLDFNRAYNPPCVFTDFATCPLPPPQNKLPFRIAAGETTYASGLEH